VTRAIGWYRSANTSIDDIEKVQSLSSDMLRNWSSGMVQRLLNSHTSSSNKEKRAQRPTHLSSPINVDVLKEKRGKRKIETETSSGSDQHLSEGQRKSLKKHKSEISIVQEKQRRKKEKKLNKKQKKKKNVCK